MTAARWFRGSRRAARRSVTHPGELHAALLDRSRYRRVFARLEKRAAESSRHALSHANHPELDLRWILQNRRLVTRWLLRKVGRRSYAVSPAREASCLIEGKERLLYRLEWPDRILQTVLAQALSECLESVFHDRLFSYRKGRSAVQAARRAARFVRSLAPTPVYVLKRDVKSYGDSIPHERLFALLDEALDGADPFVTDLVRQFIAFRYVGLDGQKHVKEQGLPTGMPLNCVLENLYLSPLDTALGSEPGVSYMRYGDDIWAATASRDTACSARDRLNELCRDFGLSWHAEKSFDYCLFAGDPPASDDEEFRAVTRIPHLGIVIDRNGHIDIPAEKLRTWRDQLKLVLRRAEYVARRLRLGPRERVRQLVHFANRFMDSTDGRFPKMDYLLTVVTQDRRFIEIDRWVAEALLAACHGRFSRTNFRRTPFRTLKQHGLTSLYLRRKDLFAKSARRGR